MSMNKIIYLAKMLGLNENSKNTADFMAEQLKGVIDIEALVEYCEDHKDGIEYQTKEERFGTLVRRYKKLEEEVRLAALNADKEQKCKSLAERFAMIRNTVSMYYDNYGKDLRPAATNATTKEKLFTKAEIKALDEVGSISHQVELSQLHLLDAALQDIFMKSYRKKAKYNSLGTGEKKVMRLINGSK